MDAFETAQALARAWLTLQPYCRLYPRQREDLARRAMECKLQLWAERAGGDGVVVDLELVRVIRLCEDLVQAIERGSALAHHPTAPPTPAEQALTAELLASMDRKVESRTLSVSEQNPGVVVVSVRGYVTADELRTSLAGLAPVLDRTGSAVLIDAQESRGHEARCGKVLEEWLASRDGRLPPRVAAVVQRGMQFVRASRALAGAHGTNWLITQERAVAERWLAQDAVGAN